MRRLAPALAILLLVATATYVLVSPAGRSEPAPVASAPKVQGSPAPAAAAAPGAAAPGAASGAATSGTAAQPPAKPGGAERVVSARRGTLTEVLTLNGRIGAETETPLSFQSAQRLAALRVSPGDAVTAGQVLAEADQRELARSLAAARDRYQTAKAKLDQAEAQLATKVRNAEQRQTAARARADRSVADAEAGVRRAEANLERVQAGASPAERRSAEIAVSTARAALSRAEADLTRLRQGPDDLELRQAEQQVVVAQAAYQKAVADSERLASGPDPNQLRIAEREVLAAQNAVVRAQLDLEKVVQPDPVALTSAQREVQRAQTALRLAEQNDRGSNSDKSNNTRASQAERRAAIDNAKLALQDAIDRYERLRAGPPPGEVAVAQRNLVSARSTLDAARERLEVVKLGADQGTLDQAKITADSARLVYEAATARVNALRAGTPTDQLNPAIAAYETAQASLRSSLAVQSELLARPTQDEMREAIEQVYAAKTSLEQASAEAQLVLDTPPADEALGEVEPLRQSVEQEQSAVRALEADLLNAQIVAPFDGVVVNVAGRPEQGIDASRAVLTLAATNAAPVVIADVPTITGARLSVGQLATVKYGGPTSGEVRGSIEDVSDLGAGQVRVRLRPSWPTAPGFGAPAAVDVVTRERADVVIVPERALVGTGARRSVQIVEGDARRTVQVDVGLITGGEAEILNGIEPDANVVTTS
ncbi:MAG: hypothetical protein IT306_11980 [Chloroflexi bacterium]|nr:hypothetical protein [Chloroflexota bacterium]